VGQFLKQCRLHFVYAGTFSFFVNVFLLAVPLYTLQVFDRVFSSRSYETLLLMTVLTAFALLAMAALDLLRARLLLAAGATLDRSLGPIVISGLLDDVVRTGGAKGNDVGLRDVASLRAYLTGAGVIALFDAPWAPVFTLIVFLFHPLLGWLATFGAATLFLLAWINEKVTRPSIDEMGNRARVASRFINASIRNAEGVRALGMQDAVTSRWNALNDLVIESQLQGGKRGTVITSLTKFTRLMIQVGMMGAGAYLVIKQEVTSGAMVATTLVLARALGPVEAAIGTWRGFIDARGAYSRLDKLIARKGTDKGAMSLPAPEGHLKVEGVVFALNRTDQPILKGVSFDLAAGDCLGVIGPSAAGKSTLARVLTGIWKPSSGAARLDDADLSTWDRNNLRAYLGYLPQDVELFPGTVGENIGRLAAADSAEIVRAAERAATHEMILRLPRGYETEVGEGGVLLSAGQRQRVALARALYGDPRLVVLDEPNSNLDGEGEEALLKVLAALKEDGVTVVIISHKPSLLANVDKLLVLNGGRMEMFGPRVEVMARVTRSASGAAAPTRTPHVVVGGTDGNASRKA
jgi:PrtD family type I secretion system ABC transporter